MATDDTKATLDHHMAALDSGDIDDLMSDYTEESVFISNLGGVVKGLDGIRAVFAATAGGMPGFEAGVEHVEGETAYVTWKADNIPFASDTFWVRDGKILAQTVALHLG
jgi:ketosteroid isomerase-like protein